MKLRNIAIFFLLLLSALAACRGTSRKTTAAATPPQTVQYTYDIINTYPHSTDSYTQGLYWHGGYLWEGTGQYGHSALNKVELETGRIVKSAPLDKDVFGEGIALLDGKIFQLTWMDGMAFVYDPENLTQTGHFRYRGEGWGLTTDGKLLYMSDGTSQISVVDPADFKKIKRISVKKNGRSTYYQLNELEWIEGKIWANVYMTDEIVIIDPQTGNVEGVVDLSGMLPESDRTPSTEVLNGIAYDPSTGRIFVTGKYWNKLFEIAIRPE